jgi:hypothetical protein
MALRSLDEILFSDESRESVNEAVRQAVAAADAAGLRPAYHPAFTQLRELEILADETGGVDLAFHLAVAEVLYAPGQAGIWLRQQAFDLLQRWDIDHARHAAYTAAWREWLGLPADLGRDAMLGEDDFGTSMRRNSPFTFLVTKK